MVILIMWIINASSSAIASAGDGNPEPSLRLGESASWGDDEDCADIDLDCDAILVS